MRATALYSPTLTVERAFCSRLMLGRYESGQGAWGGGRKKWEMIHARFDTRALYNSPMLIAALAAAAAIANSAPTPATDVCAAMIPPRLAALIARENPDYILPRSNDVRSERANTIAERGGWPCPFVAIGDFDGDGSLDRALVLKHKTESTVRLIAARNVDGMWRIELQKDWPVALSAAVVEPLEAGFYEQTKSGHNTAAQLDNLNSIQSEHTGLLAGQVEGAKAAYFYQNNAWQEIWVEE